MSGVSGWLGARGMRAPPPHALEAIASTLSRFDGAPVHMATCEGGVVAAAASDGDVDIHCEHDCVVLVWGRARCGQPDADGPLSRRVAPQLHGRYLQRGREALKEMTGEFVVAVLDGHRGEALLAVDRKGTRPLYYSTAARRLAFATQLAALYGHSGAIDQQALYDYVHFHMVPAPRTIYEGCRRLLPGTCLLWRNGRASVEPYWTIQYVETEREPLPQLKDRFLHLLERSVREAAEGGRIGAFLSGGTDSSTVTGMLRDVTGSAPRTYSIGFDAAGYDEMAYARIAARHFGARHSEYYVTPDDVVEAIPRIAAVHDQPFGNSSAVPTYYCARLARQDGTEVLLGGDGGDELFGGNDRYAKQYLYSLYGDLPEALRSLVLEPAAAAFPSMGIAGKVKRYMRNASVPMPDRYDNYNLLQRLGARVVFTSDFLAGVDIDAPRADVAAAYRSAQAGSLINRMLALDLRYTLADNDLPKVARSCELAGIGVRFPLLDDGIVAFSARLAPRLKLRGTRLRYFFKEALRGYLPDEIIAKTKHGFGLPFGPWLQTHPRLRGLAYDSLADLKRRNIVRPAFIDELRDAHVGAHPGYYGTMVWVLMMLEQWHRQRDARACDSHAPLQSVRQVSVPTP